VSSPIFGGDDFFRQMLGDILRMMPSTGSGVPWQFSYQLAADIAAGGGPDPNPDPMERIGFEQLSHIAELHVAEIAGMLPAPAGESLRIVPTSRGEWARRTLDSWRPVLDTLAAAMQADGAEAGPADPGAIEPAGEEAGGEDAAMMSLLGQWATAMFPMLTAVQVGSVAGHLAERALGPYEVPLAPAPGSELLVVSANIRAIAEDWSLPLEDVRLWVTIHEIAYHSVLSRPAVAERLSALVVEHAERVRPDPTAVQDLLADADPNDPAALARIFGDPEAFSGAAAAAGPELERVRAELDALTAAVAGYAEHVTTVAAGRLIGGQVPIVEAMRRRRVGRGEGEKVAEHLFGLSLDQPQIDRGERFVTGVLERSGDLELARMWAEAENFPTPAEVDAPGLWLARINLPKDLPAGS
jgi:putative hydrolase